MKKIFSKVLFLAVLMAGFCACKDNGNAPEQKVDYDKMIGTWTLNGLTEKWVNTTDDKVELDQSINKGTLTIRKDRAGEDGMQYFYKENFLGNEEYEGMILIENGMLNLCDIEGFTRKDLYNNYEYVVSFPAEGKMEWTYDWKGEHFRDGVGHQDHRTVIAKFTKQ